MLDNNKVILIGYSGHGYVVADIAIENQLNLIGYTEKNEFVINPFQLNYLGDEQHDIFFSKYESAEFIIGIGDNYTREEVFNFIKDQGKTIRNLISSSALISGSVKMGEGIFVNRNVTINALAKIGNNVLLNTSCIIEHECVISDSVHVAPGAVLAGNVFVGERSIIGANSVIKQGVNIGKDVIIGAGTVVINDIPDGKKIVGNPSRFL